ncbi:MAG: tetratricopeptide repeat protein [Bacteroidetes bacterium]|nr:tetratricopeptide repeat protein [Bacteroidota bacterium]
MEEENTPSDSGKGYTWAIWITAFLFATLWSIGAFFFWTLLLLMLYFVFLRIYHSGIKMPSFTRSSSAQNPYRSYQKRPEYSQTGTPTSSTQNIQRMVRIIVFAFGGLFLLFFIIGIFSGSDDPGDSTSGNQESTTGEPYNEIADGYNVQGNGYYGKAQYDSALLYYDSALLVDPENKWALYNKSLVFFSKQDYRTSIQLVRKCLRLNPDYNEGLWLLGDDYFTINMNDSATYYLEQGYNNGFRDPGFLELMGDVYAKRGERSKAISSYKESLDADPDRSDVKQKLTALDPDSRLN